MPNVTLTPRPIYKEDLATTTTRGETTTADVLAAGNVAVSKIDAIFLSDLTSAASDVAAGAAGVPIGAIYWNSTNSRVQARLS